ncbi:MAG TPA: FkbM family methyltransferase [Gaiellaceae bacterium]|nr:FkbM family methyltransferase [Gaiellaceae bacterium]
MDDLAPLVGTELDLIRLDGHEDYPFLIRRDDQVIRPWVATRGSWEPDLLSHVGSLLPEEPRIVVGGGHVGLSAFQLWRARPRARELVVFEPHAVNAALLALNVASWGASPVRTLPLALGVKTELLELASNPVNSADNRLWSSIPGELAADGGDPERWPRRTVLAVALDDYWGERALDLLFLDTQGWEPDVLEGARRVIAHARPLVVFEWWPRALVARNVDPELFLGWVERELKLTLSAIGDTADVRRLTSRLLEDDDPTAYAELLAKPRW